MYHKNVGLIQNLKHVNLHVSHGCVYDLHSLVVHYCCSLQIIEFVRMQPFQLISSKPVNVTISFPFLKFFLPLCRQIEKCIGMVGTPNKTGQIGVHKRNNER